MPLPVGTFRESVIYFGQILQEALAKHDAVGKKKDPAFAPRRINPKMVSKPYEGACSKPERAETFVHEIRGRCCDLLGNPVRKA